MVSDLVKATADPSRETARRGFLLTVLLLKIVEDFQSAEVSLIAVKGPVLSQFLYGDPSARSYEDLDILVRRDDLAQAIRVLERNGYRLDTPLDWLSPAQLTGVRSEVRLRHSLGSDVDLHWEVTPADYPFRIDPKFLWSQVQTVRIAGREVPSLRPECLLMFLCVHGAKHAWLRRAWLRDVERLIGGGARPESKREDAGDKIDWHEAMQLAERAGCERPVLLGVLLAHDFAAAEGSATSVPRDLLERARAIPIITKLVADLKDHLGAAAVWAPSGWEMVKFNVCLTPSLQAKIRHYAGLLHAPTEADARLLRLPRPLFFLYYPFRLFRLIGKYVTDKHGFRLIRPGAAE